MRVFVHLLTAGVVAALPACRLDIFGSDRDLDAEASEPFSVVLDAADDVRLSLEGINGLVAVVGDAASTDVEVNALLTVRSDSRADAEEFLSQVEVEVEDVGDEIRVRTDQPNNTGGREVLVDYELTVPRDFAVLVTNINGEVRIRSIAASVTVVNVNGAIEVSDVVGDVDANLVNGDIDVDVALDPGGRAELTVVNGNIVLEVPSTVSAMLDADVVNGTVTVTGLTIADATTTTHSVHGRLGGGDGEIELEATNGTIVVRAR